MSATVRSPVPWPVRRVGAGEPLQWLAAGWADFRRVPMIALLHGAALVLAGAAIVAVGYSRALLLAGAFSGFVLVAPGLVAGLYAQSRALERGEATGFAAWRAAWRHAGRRTLVLGLLFAAAGTTWVLLSSLIVAATPVAAGGVAGYLQFFAGQSAPALFWAWLLAGGLLAAVVFACAMVSMPMLIDRDVPVRVAILTSVAAAGANPAAAVLWAGLVMALTLLAMASVAGLLLLVPVLGHATWHAYRALVQAPPEP